MISVRDYLDFVEEQYLGGFVREGGAAVKFAVAPDGTTTHKVHAELKARAERNDYIYASVDAAIVKMAMIDKVFHELARQIPWRALAEKVALQELQELRFPAPPGQPLSLESIARHNEYDFQMLRKEFHRRLQQSIYHDYAMAHEFRIAMVLLCQAAVSSAPDTQRTAEAVLQWLTGDLRSIANLKPELIHQRIARHNARHMLYSVSPWLRKAGYSGLVIDLDIRQCAVASRTQTDKLFYTRPSVIDVYELLRQLIDATDELSASFVLVNAGNEFLSDETRGLERYWALRMRILDEVRDRHRVNPFGALIRLDSESNSEGRQV